MQLRSREAWGQVAWLFFSLAIIGNIIDEWANLDGPAWTALRAVLAIAWLAALVMWWRLRANRG